jgi:hypothetical protein
MAIKMVEPPRQSRGRASSLDEKEVDEFATAASKGWAALDQTYSDRKAASYQSIKWRRAVQAHEGDNVKVKSRIWEDGGKWIFALRTEPAT